MQKLCFLYNALMSLLTEKMLKFQYSFPTYDIPSHPTLPVVLNQILRFDETEKCTELLTIKKQDVCLIVDQQS